MTQNKRKAGRFAVACAVVLVIALLGIPATYTGWIVQGWLGEGWLAFAGSVVVVLVTAAAVLFSLAGLAALMKGAKR